MSATNVKSVNGHGSSSAAKHNLASHFIGGNRLDLAPPSKVKDFVAANDGHSVITSVSGLLDSQEYGTTGGSANRDTLG
jgi:acetyl-CoA carboxylase/biotin carboxylase 1